MLWSSLPSRSAWHWRVLYESYKTQLKKFNPLPPSVAVRKHKKNVIGSFWSVLPHFKKYHPSGNLKLNNLGISRSVKCHMLTGEILSIPLKLNFTRNTLSCCGLKYCILITVVTSMRNAFRGRSNVKREETSCHRHFSSFRTSEEAPPEINDTVSGNWPL